MHKSRQISVELRRRSHYASVNVWVQRKNEQHTPTAARAEENLCTAHKLFMHANLYKHFGKIR